MEQQPLLLTKLHIPPVRRELVSRPRLLEKLDAGLDRSLTLVSAPAGFGKTTLLSEWAHSVGAHGRAPVAAPPPGESTHHVGAHGDAPPAAPPQIAWLSLDESDNELARFLAYTIAAIRQAAGPDTTIGGPAQGMLQAPGFADASTPPPAEAVLTSLVNEIATAPSRIILVLDDYHMIEAQEVHEATAFLLEHLPPSPGGLHLIVASREDPPLPLARLRARGQLTELRASDLRFSSSEAAGFLNQVMDLDLSAEDVTALEARTEGWIAGLQLAAISIQGRADRARLIESFTGSHRFVLDYLIEEVLDQQPEAVQNCLLQSSVLKRLTGPLCEAVCSGLSQEAVSGQAFLERLDRTNLFIVPLDDQRQWYRYHHLFADLLRQRLRQTWPGKIPMLHLRASEWYEQNGHIDEAIEHALRGEDFERAAHLIERAAEAVWVRGDDAKLRRWLDKLPLACTASRPGLCVFHAWSLFASGQQAAAEQSLRAAEQALELGDLAGTPLTERDRLAPSSRSQLQGRVAATRAFFAFYRGDVAGIALYARQALDCLPREDLAWRSAATNVLGDAHDFEGEMAAAYQARMAALEASRAGGNSYQIIIANLKLAITLRHQGRPRQVTEICREQMQLAQQRGMSQAVVSGWLLAIWGEALAELGDLDGAVQKARKGVDLAERGGEVAMLASSYLFLTRVLFTRGDMAGAGEIVQKSDDAARAYDLPPWIGNQMAAWQARIWLAQDKPDAASQWAAERGLDPSGDLTYLREAEYVALARILIAQERLDGAASLLQRLLEAVEPRGHTAREIEILNLRALVYQASRDSALAVATLERALTLAEPGGMVRTFVDEGPPMERLLRSAAARETMPGYVAKLLAAFVHPAKDEKPALSQSKGRRTKEDAPSSIVDPSSRTSSRDEALVEPLSAREIEVLQLIAEGLTNPEVAARLYLSLNTVKAHTRNIYGKLGVHNRTGAVARARSLGLLTPH